jgi:hypothetical protein
VNLSATEHFQRKPLVQLDNYGLPDVAFRPHSTKISCSPRDGLARNKVSRRRRIAVATVQSNTSGMKRRHGDLFANAGAFALSHSPAGRMRLERWHFDLVDGRA